MSNFVYVFAQKDANLQKESGLQKISDMQKDNCGIEMDADLQEDSSLAKDGGRQKNNGLKKDAGAGFQKDSSEKYAGLEKDVGKKFTQEEPTSRPSFDKPMYYGSLSMPLMLPEFNEWGALFEEWLSVPMYLEQSTSMIWYEQGLQSVPTAAGGYASIDANADLIETADVNAHVEDEEVVSDNEVASVSAEKGHNVDGNDGDLNPALAWTSSASSTVCVAGVNALLVCYCVIGAYVH